MMATAPALEFKNESDLVFTDISSEAWREYQFDSGRDRADRKPR